MAVARHVQVAATEDRFLAVQRDVFIDPNSGIAAEMENVTLAVDAGGGRVAVEEHTRFKAVAVFNDPPPRFQQATYLRLTDSSEDPPQPTAPRKGQSRLRFEEEGSECHCSFAIAIVCLLLIVALVLVLIVMPAVFMTRSCDLLMEPYEIFIASGSFALITTLCCSIVYCYNKWCKQSDNILGFCLCLTCVPLTALVGLTIGETALLAGGVENGTFVDGGGKLADCKNIEVPIVLTALSWFACLLFFVCGCLQAYACKEGQEE